MVIHMKLFNSEYIKINEYEEKWNKFLLTSWAKTGFNMSWSVKIIHMSLL